MSRSNAPELARKRMREAGEDTSVKDQSAGDHLNDGADHHTIAELAFSLWQERGCPYGSPEEDWFRAEQLVNGSGAQEAIQ